MCLTVPCIFCILARGGILRKLLKAIFASESHSMNLTAAYLLSAFILAVSIFLIGSVQRSKENLRADLKAEYQHNLDVAREESYQDGYSSGYDEGWEDGCDASDSEHEDDYDEGHQEGYIKGRHAAELEHQNDFSDGYDSGYGDGYQDGFSDALDDPSNYNGPYLPDGLMTKDQFLSGIYG